MWACVLFMIYNMHMHFPRSWHLLGRHCPLSFLRRFQRTAILQECPQRLAVTTRLQNFTDGPLACDRKCSEGSQVLQMLEWIDVYNFVLIFWCSPKAMDCRVTAWCSQSICFYWETGSFLGTCAILCYGARPREADSLNFNSQLQTVLQHASNSNTIASCAWYISWN